MKLKTIRLDDLIPYENNPRINDYAVSAVVESIKQCEYVAPIIVDEDYVILAGHTRLKALKQLGYDKAECVVLEGLNEEQKRKYRILDNKTGELAGWDEELLAGELENIDLNDIHWFDDIINPDLKDDLGAGTGATKSGKDNLPEDDGIIRCPRCGAIVDEYDEGDEDDED